MCVRCGAWGDTKTVPEGQSRNPGGKQILSANLPDTVKRRISGREDEGKGTKTQSPVSRQGTGGEEAPCGASNPPNPANSLHSDPEEEKEEKRGGQQERKHGSAGVLESRPALCRGGI